MDNEVKEPAPKYNHVSPEEYLELERSAAFKNEYHYGQVLPGTMRVSTSTYDSFMYPDALIVCGAPVLEDKNFDTLLNSVLIFEILSPSTSSIHKGRKFFFYQQILWLKEYFMTDSLKRLIHITRKQADNSWKMEMVTGEQTDLLIVSINYTFSLT